MKSGTEIDLVDDRERVAGSKLSDVDFASDGDRGPKAAKLADGERGAHRHEVQDAHGTRAPGDGPEAQRAPHAGEAQHACAAGESGGRAHGQRAADREEIQDLWWWSAWGKVVRSGRGRFCNDAAHRLIHPTVGHIVTHIISKRKTSSTETLLPYLLIERTESADPSSTRECRESLACSVIFPVQPVPATENEDPSLVTPRSDSPLPRDVKFSKLIALPDRVKPRICCGGWGLMDRPPTNLGRCFFYA